MLKNSHLPSGLYVAPANSLPVKVADVPLRSPLSTTLFWAKRKICPSVVKKTIAFRYSLRAGGGAGGPPPPRPPRSPR
jgi:hypothetical protein